MSSLFHDGELEVQRRAGMAEVAAKVGAGNLFPGLTQDFAHFLGTRVFLVAAYADPEGRAWASVLFGRPGFARAGGAHDLLLQAVPLPGDPLQTTLADGPADIGLIAMEADQRLRIRVNGRASRVREGIHVEVREAFGNCPKYIQRRRPTGLTGDGGTGAAGAPAARLDERQRALVAAADTCFVASRHAERGADASHRGGRPGFVVADEDGTRLTWGDYEGNRMFQTLGNLTLDPAIGVLFVDWETGTTLQVSGRAEIVWDGERLAGWPGAQRLVTVTVDAVVERPQGFPVAFELIEAHHLNPPAPEGCGCG